MLSNEELKELFLSNGFRVKDGQDDLMPYVYAAGRAIETLVLARVVANMEKELVPQPRTYYQKQYNEGMVRLINSVTTRSDHAQV